MNQPLDRGRSETPEQRADRMWSEMLQELRVMQTGAQLTAGFLLTLPFQNRFSHLTDHQQAAYLCLVVLSVLLTVLVLSPIAIHRRITGAHVKPRLVEVSKRLMQGVLGCLTLLVTGIAAFIFDVVLGTTAAVIVTASLGGLAVLLLIVLPNIIGRRHA